MTRLSRALSGVLAVGMILGAAGCSSRHDDMAGEPHRFHGGYGAHRSSGSSYQYQSTDGSHYAGAQLDLRSPYSGESYAQAGLRHTSRR